MKQGRYLEKRKKEKQNLYFCIKTVPKAFNSRALTSEKPCINKEFHVPLMHRYLTFHMQGSGQYSINTEEASRLQLKLSIKQFDKSYADPDIVKKRQSRRH